MYTSVYFYCIPKGYCRVSEVYVHLYILLGLYYLFISIYFVIYDDKLYNLFDVTLGCGRQQMDWLVNDFEISVDFLRILVFM